MEENRNLRNATHTLLVAGVWSSMSAGFFFQNSHLQALSKHWENHFPLFLFGGNKFSHCLPAYSFCFSSDALLPFQVDWEVVVKRRIKWLHAHGRGERSNLNIFACCVQPFRG